ncbi:death-associated protein kinase related-like [Bacillus rossius redtenbacheri]|uniref:death-associated protein kinase related-like n=1 Tax=Bacillus rossius redtenbacheri TaxID=93214 RepID=UPI002FDDB915
MRELMGAGGSPQPPTRGARAPSRPGYMDLSPEQAERLICTKPIEQFYDVEEQPFARGKYAAVRRCRERATGRRFAAKFLRKRRRSEDLRPDILHEVAVLDACAACPRIARLHRVFESAHDMVLLLELAPGGELQMLLDKDEVPEERHVKRLMREILDGLVFLHSINVAHLDIKPQNLVLTADFPQGEVKLCDLGISRYISPGADIRDFLGTPDYVAPEVLNYEPISLATDMWSVGVILYVLLTGFSPFGGDSKQETFCNISQCRLDFPDDLFEDISENAKDLMRKLMVKDPSQRLSAQASLKHPWFSAVDSVPPHVTATHILTRTCEVQETLHISTASLTPRKIVAMTGHGSSVQQMTAVSKPVTKSSMSFAKTAPPEAHRSSANYAKTEQSLATADLQKGVKDRGSSGMSSFRKNSFKKRMESLKQTYVEESDSDNNNNTNNDNLSVGPVNDNRFVHGDASSLPSERTTDTTRRLASVNKAIAVQTMPVGGLGLRGVSNSNATVACRQVNVNISSGSTSARPDSERETLYTFRRCIILGDSEDESSDSVPAKVLSIHCSSSSSESGLGSYSDQSSSDCSSDTVSEMSIDSSSDRSSIISLDDSLTDCSFAKVNGRAFSQAFSQTRSAWELAAAGGGNRPVSGIQPRLRACGGSLAKVLTRFNTPVVQEARPHGLFPPSPRRQAPKYAYTSALNHVLVATATDKSPVVKKVDVMREQNGNLVVIREARPGRYSTRFSEVKCESLQSRIKKLQVQGTKS